MEINRMIYQLYDNMDQCSEQEIARLLPLVSEQRRRQAMKYTHIFGQYCCLKSYELLIELLREWKWEEFENKLPEFKYNEYGTPYLEDGPYFSISHSKRGIAVAISDTPIGIDIECIRNVDEGLIRKTMNSEEQKFIRSNSRPEIEFIRLWTRKEAYVKMKGTGIISDMHAILTNVSSVNWKEIVNIESGYICTIVN